MSTAVDVRFVPAPTPLPRRELTPVRTAGRTPTVATTADRGTATTTGGTTRRAAAAVGRARPARSRPEAVAAVTECLPVPERLGSSTLATYRHLPGGPGDEDVPVPRAAPAPDPAVGAAADLDPRQACCMVALAAVEVIAGTRPLAQLARWLEPDVYDALARRAALTAPRSRVLDPAAADLRGADPGAWSRRPSVRRVRACRVDGHTLEASVVVSHVERVRAVAVRLTRRTGRWRASALVIG